MNDDGRPAHGGPNFAELRALGLQARDVLDFSASVNPLGAPPSVADAIARADLAAYPDTDCAALRDALGARLGVAPDWLLVGNGSTELIHLAARAFLGHGTEAVIFTPTFGEYEAASQIAGVDVAAIGADEAAGFAWDIVAAAQIIESVTAPLVFLCNPNNPTGRYLGITDARRIAAATAAAGGTLLLDEAYLPFVERRWDSRELLDLGNVALLRSMTKDYALTALRLGYLIAPPPMITRLRRLQHSWSVNGLAQAAGIAALADAGHPARGRDAADAAKRYLAHELAAMGLQPLPSSANFVLVRIGDAAGLRRRLLVRHRIAVRDCASFGLPQCIRIGMRALADCERLVAALRLELKSHTEQDGEAAL